MTKGAKIRASEAEMRLDELYFGKPVRRHVKEFALLFALILFCITNYQLYRHPERSAAIAGCFAGGALFVFMGCRCQRVLYPVWKLWMRLADFLGLIVTFVVLLTLWTVAVIPTALLLRLLRKRVMDLSFKAPVDSYWEVRDESKHDFQLLKKQF